MEHIVVLITAPTAADARRIARTLVEERLAACVNVLPGCESVYRWEEKVVEEAEAMMVAKTSRDMFPELARRVAETAPVCGARGDRSPAYRGGRALSAIPGRRGPARPLSALRSERSYTSEAVAPEAASRSDDSTAPIVVMNARPSVIAVRSGEGDSISAFSRSITRMTRWASLP